MVKANGGWIGVDLDGTIAFYDGWTKWDEFGAPIPAMVDRIKAWLADGVEVRVVTARIGIDDSIVHTCYKTGERFSNMQMKYAIANWTEKHIGQRLRAQCYKDLGMLQLWDDRAVGVVANTGQTLSDAAVAEANAQRGKVYGQEDQRD